MNELTREELGQVVRRVWVAYCIETDHVYKPDHVDSWEQLDEWAKEVDRRIGVAVARAQMERDAALVCSHCKGGEELKNDGEWHHLFRGHLRNVCHAAPIRAAFAALHPEPANG